MKKILFVLFAVFFIACEKEALVSKEDINYVAIIAHRGVTTNAPENGLRAIAQAADIGLDAVEFDIQLSKDGELVVFHDDDLFQRTGEKGRICDFTVQELKKLHLINKAGVLTNEEIPTLREVLDRVGTKISYFIELKFSSINMEQKLVKVLNEYSLDSLVTVLSFDNNALVRLHALNKSLPLCLLLYDDALPPINNTFPQKMDCSHLTGVGLHYSLCKRSTLEYLKGELNINHIYVYTVNSIDKISKDHFKWIDGIITDVPEEWLTFKFDY